MTALKPGDWVIPADAGLGEFILGTAESSFTPHLVFHGDFWGAGAPVRCSGLPRERAHRCCGDFGGPRAKAQLSKAPSLQGVDRALSSSTYSNCT